MIEPMLQTCTRTPLLMALAAGVGAIVGTALNTDAGSRPPMVAKTTAAANEATEPTADE
jgi:hypothetical protein